ncbi:hypothetical protein [Oleiphilus sp. HI0043]|nr:hypothetical protein [Oleiphilus sp. HI0043]
MSHTANIDHLQLSTYDCPHQDSISIYNNNREELVIVNCIEHSLSK